MSTTNVANLPFRFHRRLWKDREKWLEKNKERATKMGLAPGRYGTGPGEPVLVDVILADSHATTDHVGTSVSVVNYCAFTGEFDPVYIHNNSAALGLYQYGDYATGGGGYIYCSHLESKMRPGSTYIGTTQNPAVFEFITTWSPITPERLDLSPLDRPAVISGGGIELTEVRNHDVNGDAMLNSAGDCYENLPQFYIPGCELSIAWNVSTNPMTNVLTYSFSTNSKSIWGQDAYSGVMGKIASQQSFETYQGAEVEYWRITVPIKFRNDGLGWNFQPFDYGYRYLSGGSPVNYVDPTTRVHGPVFLDGSGGLLNGNGTGAPTAPSVYPAGTPAGYQTLTGVAWSGLGVPVSPFA